MSFFRRIGKLLPRGRGGVPTRQVRVVTDSTSDLPPDVAEELGITVVPLHVLFGDESYRDGVDLMSEEFFRRLAESKALPTTSQPSVGEFRQVYERLADGTDKLLSIHLSARFSGTAGAARQAGQSIAGRCSIEVIDSETTSMSMGLAVIEAARLAQAGADLDACTAAARSVLRRQRLAVALDTLEFLRRGGRIGRAQAFLGGLLRLKPVLTIRNGEAFPLARKRTRRQALDEVVRVCLQDGVEVERAAVMHATTPDDAGYLRDELHKRFPNVHVHMGRFGPVIGVHGGPGLAGMAVVLAEQPPAKEA